MEKVKTSSMKLFSGMSTESADYALNALHGKVVKLQMKISDNIDAAYLFQVSGHFILDPTNIGIRGSFLTVQYWRKDWEEAGKKAGDVVTALKTDEVTVSIDSDSAVFEIVEDPSEAVRCYGFLMDTVDRFQKGEKVNICPRWVSLSGANSVLITENEIKDMAFKVMSADMTSKLDDALRKINRKVIRIEDGKGQRFALLHVMSAYYDPGDKTVNITGEGVEGRKIPDGRVCGYDYGFIEIEYNARTAKMEILEMNDDIRESLKRISDNFRDTVESNIYKKEESVLMEGPWVKNNMLDEK